MDPILSQMNPVQILTPYFRNVHFNATLPNVFQTKMY